GRLGNHAGLRAGYHAGSELISADMRLFDEVGHLVAEAEGLHLKRANEETLRRATGQARTDWLYEVRWQQRLDVNPSVQPNGDSPNTIPELGPLREHARELAGMHGFGRLGQAMADLDRRSSTYLLSGRRE